MTTAFLLSLEETRWRVGRIDGEEITICELSRLKSEGYDLQAEKLAAILQELDYDNQGVCLGLPNSMVFTGTIDTADLQRKNRRSAMLYRLEEQLPCEAEKLTTDFITNPSGSCLGLAVETDRISEIITELENADVEILSVRSTSLLGLWASLPEASKEDKYILLADGDVIEIFRLSHKKPLSWFSCEASPQQLAECLHALILTDSHGDEQTTVRVLGNLDNKIASEVESLTGIKLEALIIEEAPFSQAIRATKMLTDGQDAGWVDFRRGALAPPNKWEKFSGLLKSACILGVVLMAILISGMYWRSKQYEKIARSNEQQMADEYSRFFPGRLVPINVKTTLQSEYRHMSGIRGGDSGTPQLFSALDTLKQIVGALPPAVRLRILDIRIGATSIFIDGQVRDHSSADTIAQSLKRAGLDVDSPRTENIKAGGVSFTIAGKPKPEKQNASASSGRQIK